MITTLNKILISALGILAVISGLLIAKSELPGPILGAAGGAFSLNTGYNQPTNSAGAISTSSLNYLTPGTGTTSITIDTRGTNQVDLDIFMLASTTATTDLRWTVEFSHSTSTVASEQLWFPLTQELASNSTTTFRTALAKEYGWIPALDARHAIATSTGADSTFTSLTTSTRVSIEDIASPWTRIIFYIPTAGATLSESTALGSIPVATSTNVGIAIFPVRKDPL